MIVSRIDRFPAPRAGSACASTTATSPASSWHSYDWQDVEVKTDSVGYQLLRLNLYRGLACDESSFEFFTFLIQTAGVAEETNDALLRILFYLEQKFGYSFGSGQQDRVDPQEGVEQHASVEGTVSVSPEERQWMLELLFFPTSSTSPASAECGSAGGPPNVSTSEPVIMRVVRMDQFFKSHQDDAAVESSPPTPAASATIGPLSLSVLYRKILQLVEDFRLPPSVELFLCFSVHTKDLFHLLCKFADEFESFYDFEREQELLLLSPLSTTSSDPSGGAGVMFFGGEEGAAGASVRAEERKQEREEQRERSIRATIALRFLQNVMAERSGGESAGLFSGSTFSDASSESAAKRRKLSPSGSSGDGQTATRVAPQPIAMPSASLLLSFLEEKIQNYTMDISDAQRQRHIDEVFERFVGRRVNPSSAGSSGPAGGSTSAASANPFSSSTMISKETTDPELLNMNVNRGSQSGQIVVVEEDFARYKLSGSMRGELRAEIRRELGLEDAQGEQGASVGLFVEDDAAPGSEGRPEHELETDEGGVGLAAPGAFYDACGGGGAAGEGDAVADENEDCAESVGEVEADAWEPEQHSSDAPYHQEEYNNEDYMEAEGGGDWDEDHDAQAAADPAVDEKKTAMAALLSTAGIQQPTQLPPAGGSIRSKQKTQLIVPTQMQLQKQLPRAGVVPLRAKPPAPQTVVDHTSSNTSAAGGLEQNTTNKSGKYVGRTFFPVEELQLPGEVNNIQPLSLEYWSARCKKEPLLRLVGGFAGTSSKKWTWVRSPYLYVEGREDPATGELQQRQTLFAMLGKWRRLKQVADAEMREKMGVQEGAGDDWTAAVFPDLTEKFLSAPRDWRDRGVLLDASTTFVKQHEHEVLCEWLDRFGRDRLVAFSVYKDENTGRFAADDVCFLPATGEEGEASVYYERYGHLLDLMREQEEEEQQQLNLASSGADAVLRQDGGPQHGLQLPGNPNHHLPSNKGGKKGAPSTSAKFHLPTTVTNKNNDTSSPGASPSSLAIRVPPVGTAAKSLYEWNYVCWKDPTLRLEGVPLSHAEHNCFLGSDFFKPEDKGKGKGGVLVGMGGGAPGGGGPHPRKPHLYAAYVKFPEDTEGYATSTAEGLQAFLAAHPGAKIRFVVRKRSQPDRYYADLIEIRLPGGEEGGGEAAAGVSALHEQTHQLETGSAAWGAAVVPAIGVKRVVRSAPAAPPARAAKGGGKSSSSATTKTKLVLPNVDLARHSLKRRAELDSRQIFDTPAVAVPGSAGGSTMKSKAPGPAPPPAPAAGGRPVAKGAGVAASGNTITNGLTDEEKLALQIGLQMLQKQRQDPNHK